MWLLGLALGAQPLAAVGEVLGDAVIESIEEHPEYIRLHLALPDTEVLQVEVTQGESGGACHHHGHIVQPRWELLGKSVEVEAQPPSVLALCARLAERGTMLQLAARPPAPQPQVTAPDVPAPRPLRPPRLRLLHGVLAALLLVLPAMIPGTRVRGRALAELLLVAAVGVGSRLLLSPRGLQIWDGADRLLLALGREESHPLFGDTYATVMSVFTMISGGDLAVVFSANLAISCLAPPLAWAVARQLSDRRAALLAGLMMALLPVHLRLAGSEVMAVLVVTLSLLSVSCALRFADRGETSAGLCAALSAVLVVHARPEAIPFALLPLLIGLRGLRTAPAAATISAVIVLGMLWQRISYLAVVEGVDTLQVGQLADLHTLLRRFLPSWSGMDASTGQALLPLQLQLTPILWTLLAGLAVRRAAGRWLVLWFVLSAGAVLSRTWPMHDLIRLHLPSLVPVVILAAIAAAERLRQWPLPVVAAGLCALALPHLPMVVRPWAVTEGWRVGAASLATLPEDATLLYPARNNRGHQQGAVLSWLTRDRPGVVVQDMRAFLDAPPEEGVVYALMSELCGARLTGDGILPDPCPPLSSRYTLEPMHTERIDAFSGSFVRYETDTLEVGLFRLSEPVRPAQDEPAR